jgi:class 3 adenylate cyclase
MGDGIALAFPSASAAVNAPVAAQRALDVVVWPRTTPLQVRMGVHTGEAELRENTSRTDGQISLEPSFAMICHLSSVI